ncbi:hypothetical protein CVT24_000148 [Panaeolus cyanescens]|uniref:Uncharacterized protein n=1 Tax=Panaeolus cyanescens TaxID=181874 RepID=A0A409WBR6_9AGAR|nr:hypothetical protein CVT24_000148 [Panaeolus cyanescens]
MPPRTKSGPTLPNELLFSVFESLSKDRHSLYNLLFLSRSYRITIERLLYAEMTDWIYTASHDGFVATITQNARLASYVRTFGCIERMGSAQERDSVSHPGEMAAYWSTIVGALKLMTGLGVFIINLHVPVQLPPIERLLHALENMRDLHTLFWGPSIYDPDATPCLVSCLRTRLPQLRVLHLDVCVEIDRMLVLGDGACPRLESVGGAWQDILCMLSGRKRPIGSLTWFKSPWDEPLMQTSTLGNATEKTLNENLGHVLRSLEELYLYHCFLGLVLAEPPVHALPFFFDRCPNLRHLHAEIDQVVAHTHALGTSFPKLRTLTLDTSENADATQWATPEALTAIFETCEKLDTIDVGPCEIWYHSERPLDLLFVYERWVPIRVRRQEGEGREDGDEDEGEKGEKNASAGALSNKLEIVSRGRVFVDGSSMHRYLLLFNVTKKDRRVLA